MLDSGGVVFLSKEFNSTDCQSILSLASYTVNAYIHSYIVNAYVNIAKSKIGNTGNCINTRGNRRNTIGNMQKHHGK